MWSQTNAVDSIIDVPCFKCIVNNIVTPFFCRPEKCIELEQWLLNAKKLMSGNGRLDGEDEKVSEEGSEEVETQEAEPQESECYVVPEQAKPLVECCKKYAKGEIDESTFFAEALVKTGEFMKAVKEAKPQP